MVTERPKVSSQFYLRVDILRSFRKSEVDMWTSRQAQTHEKTSSPYSQTWSMFFSRSFSRTTPMDSPRMCSRSCCKAKASGGPCFQCAIPEEEEEEKANLILSPKLHFQ